VRYPLIELLTGAFFALAGWHFGLNAIGLAWAALAALLVAQFFIDFDTQLLPDDLNYLILWGGLIAAALGWTGIPLSSSVWGAVFGYLSLWTVYQVHHALTGKQGMGYGDFKLLAGLGAWFGAPYLVALILLSSLVGSILGGALLVFGRLAHRDIPIPFGPFLAGAGLLAMALGPGTLEAWLPIAFPLSQPLR
jgi:leader peptidase (prepilin peptidase)/N-methyltransferase